MVNIFIMDTNIWLHRPFAFMEFETVEPTKVVMLKSVLQEIDHLKDRQDQTGYLAREASRIVLQMMESSIRTQNGWMLNDLVEFILDENTENRIYANKSIMNISVDDRILDCGESYRDYFIGSQVYLISLDRNLAIRAKNRNLQVLDPAGWFKPTINQFVMPMLTRGLSWTSDSSSYFQLPINSIEGIHDGLIEVWPYFGFKSGEFSHLHIRYFPISSTGEKLIEKGAPLIILSVANFIPYHQIISQTPYVAFTAQTGSFYEIPLSQLHLRIDVRAANIGFVGYQPNYQNSGLALGLSGLLGGGLLSSLFSGYAAGNAISQYRAGNQKEPKFDHLAIKITVNSIQDPASKPVGYFFSNYLK